MISHTKLMSSASPSVHVVVNGRKKRVCFNELVTVAEPSYYITTDTEFPLVSCFTHDMRLTILNDDDVTAINDILFCIRFRSNPLNPDAIKLAIYRIDREIEYQQGLRNDIEQKISQLRLRVEPQSYLGKLKKGIIRPSNKTIFRYYGLPMVINHIDHKITSLNKVINLLSQWSERRLTEL